MFKAILALFGQFSESRDVEGWKPPSIDRFTKEYREAMEIQETIMDKLKELKSEEVDTDQLTTE